tara:strand:- start:243 stop:503 length:261 start_codon:yes stop_codon:yes gene_type:complete
MTTDAIITHIESRCSLAYDKLDSIRDGPHTKLQFCRKMFNDTEQALEQLKSSMTSATSRADELNMIADKVHTMTKNELVDYIRGLI